MWKCPTPAYRQRPRQSLQRIIVRRRPLRKYYSRLAGPLTFVGGTRHDRIKRYKRQAGAYRRHGQHQWAIIELQSAANEALNTIKGLRDCSMLKHRIAEVVFPSEMHGYPLERYYAVAVQLTELRKSR